MSKNKIGATVVAVGIVGAAIAGFIMTEKIPAGYVGVQYSMKGGVSDEILTQGWHLVSPTKKVSLYSVATEQLFMSKDKREGSKEDDSFNVVCKDGQLNVDFEMAYSFDSDKVTSLYTKYRGLSGEDVINTKIRGKIKTLVNEVTSKYTVLEAHMEKKSELNKEMTEHLKENLKEYGITVESATLSRTKANSDVEKAIVERTKAAQELETEKQKQEKAKLEAETKKIKAQGEADAALIKAQGEAAANEALQKSISDELIRMTEAEARVKHGWIEVTGADTVVTQK